LFTGNTVYHRSISRLSRSLFITVAVGLGGVSFLGNNAALDLGRSLGRRRLVSSLACVFFFFFFFLLFFLVAVFVFSGSVFALGVDVFSSLVVGGFALFGSGGCRGISINLIS
jgi:hypothetical protein